MNAPVVLAQLLGSTSQPNPPHKNIKLEKPQNGAAVTVHLDGQTQLDFSDISSEKLTFVRVGEKLIVLFDNQSTVTVDPVFASDGHPLADIAFEMGPDRTLTGDQFASLFPITTDQSVLPAAGNGGNGPTAGANFSAAHVDGLAPGGTPLALLGPEDNGSTFGIRQQDAANPTPIPGAIAAVTLNEDGLPHGNPGGPGDVATLATTVSGSLNVNFGTDVVGRSFSFAAGQAGLDGLTSDGQAVHLVVTTVGGLPTLIGFVGSDPSIAANQVFTVSLDANSTVDGTFTFTLLRPLDHPIGGTEDTLNLSVNVIATDGSGDTAPTVIHVNVNDDSPIIVAANETHSTLVDPVSGTIATQTGSLGISWGADRFNDHVDGGVSGSTGHSGDRAVVFSDAVVSATGDTAGVATAISTLTSHGEIVHYALLNNGTELVAYTGNTAPTGLPADATAAANAHIVFVVGLSDASDSGSYVISQYQSLDHNSGAQTFDSIDLAFHFTATDSDGDPVSGTLSATITDTVPVVTGAIGDHAVAESTTSTADNSFIAATTGAVSLNIDWRSDDNNPTPGAGAHDRSVAFTSDTLTTLEALHLTSNGATITYSLSADGETLTATAGGSDAAHTVFTVQLSDGNSGSYTFTLLDNLDHATGAGTNDQALTFSFTATDSDGDTTAPASFTVDVTDDVPTIGAPVSETVAESTTTTADNSFVTATATGSLAIDWNSDANNPTPGAGAHDRSVAFTSDTLTTLAALNLTSNGAVITYSLSADGETLTAMAGKATVFTVQLSDSNNGSYTFTLLDNLDHAAGSGANDQALTFSFTATDSDGDTTAPSNFTVHVTDDVPTIGTPVAETVAESTTATSDNSFITAAATGSLAIDWNSDANNPTPGAGPHDRSVGFTSDTLTTLAALHLTSNGTAITYSLSADGETLTAMAGKATVFTVQLSDSNNGSYTFTLLDNLDNAPGAGANNQSFTFSFTATDSDGDTTAPSSFTVTVKDDVPVAGVGDTRVVEEAHLLNGTSPDIFDLQVTGKLNIDWNSDDHNSGTIANRSVSFANATAANNVTVTGEAGNHLTSDGHDVNYAFIGGNLVGYTGNSPFFNQVFVVSLNDNNSGSYSFTLLGNLDHASGSGPVTLTFAYTATDSDGDPSSNVFSVTVQDDAPIAHTGDTRQVDEDNLPNGSSPHASDLRVSGDLNIQWGADDANPSSHGGVADRSVAFTNANVVVTDNHGHTVSGLTADGAPVFYALIGDVLVGYTGSASNPPTSITAGNVVFNVSLSDSGDGSYAFKLLGNIDHPAGSGQNTLDFTFNYTATDSDGDTSSSTFSVIVKDDVPVAHTGDGSTVDEDDLSDGTSPHAAALTVTNDLNINWGADNVNPTSHGGAGDRSVAFSNASVVVTDSSHHTIANLTSDGATVHYAVLSGGILVGYTGAPPSSATASNVVFNVSLSDSGDGSYTFTLLGNLDHPNAHGQNTLGLTFNYTATDSDGDTSSNAFTVTVQDDVPTLASQTPVTIADGNFLGGAGDFTTAGSWTKPLGAVDTKGFIDGWTYTASTVDGAAAARVELERIDSGYLGTFSSNGSPMVDLEASPGNIQISQAVTGLTAGEKLLISFEIGEANFGSAKLAVLWDGNVVGTFDPQNGQMQLESLVVTANGTNDVLTFREIGASGDNTGTFLANVSAQQVSGSVDEGGLNVPFDLPAALPAIVGNDAAAATVATGSLASLVHFGADGPSMTANINTGFQLVPQTSADATSFVTGLHLTSLGFAVDQATLSGHTLTATAQDGHNVFTLTINGDGSWTFTLLAPLDNAHLGEDATTIDFSGLVKAVDFDGDAISLAPGSFSVAIVDDVPVVSAAADTVSVSEHGLTGFPSVQAATGFLHINWGADDGAAKHLAFTTDSNGHYGPALTSGGVALDYFVTTVTGSNSPELVAYKHGGDPNDPVFTITLYAPNGEGAPYYTFALFHPLDESGAGADTLPLQFGVTATDSDGDAVHQTFTVNVTDDVPTVLSPAGTAGVSEANLLTDKNPAGIDQSDARSLHISYGADTVGAHLSFALDSHGNPIAPAGLTSDGVALDYALQTLPSGEQQLVAYKDGDTADHPVFIVALNSPVNPTYIFTLFHELDNSGSNDTTLPLTFTVNATDGDGDSVQQSFTVNVTDDTPIAQNVAAAMSENDTKVITLVEGTDYAFGADTHGAAISLGMATISDAPAGVTLGIPGITLGADGHTITIDSGTAFDALGAGQQATLLIPFTVTDGDGDTVTRDITVTITGTDDAPVISIPGGESVSTGVAGFSGEEVVTRSLTEHDTHLTTTGTLTVSDVDAGDVVTATVKSVSGGGAGYNAQNALGFLTLTPSSVIDGTHGSPETLNWTFDAGSQTFGFLPIGFQVVLNYTVEVTDAQGEMADQVISVLITGTDEAPVITIPGGESVSTGVAGFSGEEVVTRSLTEHDTHLTTAGTLTVSDVDAGDVVTATVKSVSGGGAGYNAQDALGFLTLTPSNVIDGTHGSPETLNWTFDAGSQTFGFLPIGFQVVLNYTVEVTDAHGAKTDQVISVLITGTDEAPVITIPGGESVSTAVAGFSGEEVVTRSLTEHDSHLTTAGTLTVSDVDAGDVVTATVKSVSGGGAGYNAQDALGFLTLTPSNVIDGTHASPETLNWTFDAGSQTFGSLPNGFQVVLNYTVEVTDAHGAKTDQVISVLVTGTDEAPVITSAATATEAEGTAASHVVYTVAATDVDSGTVLHYSIDGTDSALFNINRTTGEVTFKSTPDFETKNSYNVVVHASDGTLDTSEAVTINVTDVAPVITSAASAAVAEGTPTSTVVYDAAATDVAGGTVTYALSGVDAAAFTINPTTGAVQFNAAPDFETKSSYNIDVKASDGTLTSTESVTIHVTDVAPVNTVPGAQTIAENGNLVFSSANSDAVSVFDVAGGNLTVTLTAAHGALTLHDVAGLSFANGDGTSDNTMTFTGSQSAINAALDGLSYAPASNYVGSDSVQVTTSDGTLSHSDTVAVTVQNVNHAPVAVDDVYTGGAGSSTPPGSGWTLFPSNGHYYQVVAGNFSWSQANAAAIAAGGYLATVTGAAENTFIMSLDNSTVRAQSLWLGASDAATEGTWKWVSGPEAGTTFFQGDPTGQNLFHGSAVGGDYSNWNIGEPNNGTGYDSGENYAEMLVVFGGGWNDATGAAAAAGDVADYVGYVVEYSAQTVVPTENSPVVIAASALLANDSDPDAGDTFSITSVQSAAHGTVSLSADHQTITFTPDANYSGAASFTYTITDSHGATSTATVSLNLAEVNYPPVAVADTVNVNEDASAAAASRATGVLANDTDRNTGDEATFAVSSVLAGTSGTASNVVTGSATIVHGIYGDLSINADGTYSYTPDNANAEALAQGVTANDVFTYTATDASGGSSSTTLTFHITGQDDAPVNGVPGAQTVTENTSLVLSSANGDAISVSDVDNGSLTVTLSVSHGALTLHQETGLHFTSGDGTSDASMTFSGTVSDINAALNGLSYAPASSYTGGDTVQIVTSDGTLSDTDTVGITVQVPANHAPTITSGIQAGSVTEDATPGVGGNRIVNGGFETADSTGWTVTSNGSYSFRGDGFLNSGNHDFTAGIFGGETITATTTLSQTVSTVAGATYALDFFLAAGSYLHHGDTVVVSWDGQPIATIVDSGATGYVPYAFNVVGTGSDTVTFTFKTAGFTWDLDDVSLTSNVSLPGVEKTSGTITFKDADVSDTHTITVTPSAGGYLGTFSTSLGPDSTGHVTGDVNWSFSVNDSDIQFLAAGQTLTQEYTVSIDDGHGGVTTQEVDVNLHGVNDAPVLSLDANHSSGAAAANYQATYASSGSAKAIAGTDTAVTDVDNTTMASATITLTNAMAGDSLNVGSLPTGITSSVSNSGGVIIVTLTGSSSLANYEAAIEGITFSNGLGNLDTSDRNITVVVNDGLANSNTTTSTIHVSDTTAPAVPVITGITNSSDSGAQGDGITNDTTPTFTGTAEANSTVTIKDGNTVLGTVTANGSGAWSFTPTNSHKLSSGTHNITATAEDASGNTSTASAAYSVTIDSTAPNAPSGLTHFGSNTVSWDAASDKSGGSGVDHYLYQVDSGNKMAASGAYISTTGTSATWSNTSGAQSWTLFVEAVDVAGNTSSATRLQFSAPAGVSGEAINLALTDPSPDHVGAISLTIAGLAAGWALNEGIQNGDGSWTVQTNDIAALSITSPQGYTGALVLNVAESWTNADGTIGHAYVADNVEAYAKGSPIFAWSGDDTLTASIGNDTLVFANKIGTDVVHNFDTVHDKIDLIGFNGFSSFADVQVHLGNDAAGNAVITLADGETITLAGVNASSLNAGDFEFNQTPVTYNIGDMAISDGALLPLSGIVDNTGSIHLGATASGTDLEIVQHGVTLQGGGSVVLSDNDANVIFGSDPSVTLTNVDNVISGAGQLGDGQMTLVNEGSIIANGSHALVVDTGDNAVVNSGMLESTGAGGLLVHSDLVNDGLLWANGGDLHLDGAVSGAGSALISGNGSLELGGAFNEQVVFDDNAAGTLKLDHSVDFKGLLAGFDGHDAIDLGDILAATASLNYTANAGGTGGILTVTDGANTANIALAGQYAASDFHIASDSGNHALIQLEHQAHQLAAVA